MKILTQIKKSLTVIQEEIVAVTAVKAVSARALKIKKPIEKRKVPQRLQTEHSRFLER